MSLRYDAVRTSEKKTYRLQRTISTRSTDNVRNYLYSVSSSNLKLRSLQTNISKNCELNCNIRKDDTQIRDRFHHLFIPDLLFGLKVG